MMWGLCYGGGGGGGGRQSVHAIVTTRFVCVCVCLSTVP